MSALGVVLSGTMAVQTIRMSIPYVCASLGGVMSERSGVVNIGLEGIMLASAFASVAVHAETHSAVAGLVAGIACGALVGLVHALLVVRGRIDAIVSGIAINLVAAGGTRFGLRALFGSSSNSPSIEAWNLAVDPFHVLTVLMVAAAVWTLPRTRFGLELRACGEDPSAAHAVGIDVDRVRLVAVSLGGAAAGLGGTALAYDLHQFQAGMTGGRGFIALAAVIISGWNPLRAAVACLAFAALDALQIVLQGQTALPAEIFSILPFVATLFALVTVSRRAASRPPAGLGRHPSA